MPGRTVPWRKPAIQPQSRRMDVADDVQHHGCWVGLFTPVHSKGLYHVGDTSQATADVLIKEFKYTA